METDNIEQDFSHNSQGTPPDFDKQSMVEELFNCEKRIDKLINSWLYGENGSAIVGRRFANKQRSALLGVVNTTNAFSKALGDDTKAILYRAVKAFVSDMLNEPTIHRKHYYSLVFTYWHTLELFLGLPRNGHGARVLKDVSSGLHTPDPEEKKETAVEIFQKRFK